MYLQKKVDYKVIIIIISFMNYLFLKKIANMFLTLIELRKICSTNFSMQI